ncbi:GTP cyclohydrolase I [Streptomyces lavendulae]|uniref:GTP cyclohydrolase I n=1 Tax=Streptomyces lavendulae TaxID=1914 RepID=UPI003406B64A
MNRSADRLSLRGAGSRAGVAAGSQVAIPTPGSEIGSAKVVIDFTEVERLYRQLLTALGQDIQSESLQDTPARVARSWQEFLAYDPGPIEASFEYEESYFGQQYIAVAGIRAWSMCQHHLLPFHVDAAVGYVPAGRVLGLSKLSRIVHMYAHRLQLQEQLTAQVAAEVARLTGSNDVGVWVVGEHLCMEMRGVRDQDARTLTECLHGQLATDQQLAQRIHAAARSAVPFHSGH